MVPEDLAHAFVAVEDARFYDHNGIDIKGIIRAAVVGIKNKFKFSEGASTITQQLLKNNVFTADTKKRRTTWIKVNPSFFPHFTVFALRAFCFFLTPLLP